MIVLAIDAGDPLKRMQQREVRSKTSEQSYLSIAV
jgi:hypothetical protein